MRPSITTVNLANLETTFIEEIKFAANENSIHNFRLQLHIHAAQSKI